MTEMEKLIAMLTDAKIPFETRDIFGTVQVCYPNQKNMICDAVCHSGSYGYKQGLLEIMGLVDGDEVGDDVEGHLTAEEVFRRISEDYNNNEKKEGATMELGTNFYNAKQAYRDAKKNYEKACENTKNALIALLPSSGNGVTAAELSKQCGLDSHDIANLLARFRYGEVPITRTYVALNEDGTIDYDRKIVKTYCVNTYRKNI